MNRPAGDPVVTPNLAKKTRKLPVELGVAVVLVLLSISLSIRFPDFGSGANISVILGSLAEIAIIAAGMTLVMATGGIDISVGSVIGLCSVLLGILTVNHGWPAWAGILAVLVVGGTCGLVNGVLVARFKVPSIIATLAMFSAARAAAYVLSGGNTLAGLPDQITNLGYTNFAGLPLSVWISAVVLLAAGIWLKRTSYGRTVLALGGNREAAYLSGIKTERVETLVYVISGVCAGLSSLAVCGRAATAVPDAGKFYEMTAITAVVMGGTPTTGGRATMTGTLLGVLTIGVVQNGMRSYGKDDTWALCVLGLVLLLAVEVDRWRTQREARALASQH